MSDGVQPAGDALYLPPCRTPQPFFERLKTDQPSLPRRDAEGKGAGGEGRRPVFRVRVYGGCGRVWRGAAGRLPLAPLDGTTYRGAADSWGSHKKDGLEVVVVVATRRDSWS